MPLVKSHKKPAMTTHPRLWWSRVKRSWPFFVWLGVVVLCLYFYTTHSRFWGITGVVQSTVEMITPLDTARLESIQVYLGERVKKGQVIVQMDTSLIDAEIAVDEAQMLEAEGTIAGYQRDMLQIVRQFETARNEAEIALQEMNIERDQTRQKLTEYQKELDQREALLGKQLIQASDLFALRADVASLKIALDGFKELERIHNREVKRAEEERLELQRALRVKEGESVAVAIARKMEARQHILEQSHTLRMKERERYTLRASRDSVVSRIYAQQGDVVNAGSDLVRLVSEVSSHIEGFLPEAHTTEISVGQIMRVLASNGREKYTAKVLSISPDIQSLPGRASPIVGQSIRGRRVLFELMETDHAMVPGETVKIRPL